MRKKDLEVRVRDRQRRFEVNKIGFASLIAGFVPNNMKKEALKSGFRACGLYPWDIAAIDFEKLAVRVESPDDTMFVVKIDDIQQKKWQPCLRSTCPSFGEHNRR